MSMHEVEALLEDSVDLLVQQSPAPEILLSIRTLIEIPSICGLDAGAPQASLPVGVGVGNIYESGIEAMSCASSSGRPDLVYDWCAFLLNFWSHMPDEDGYESTYIREHWIPLMQTQMSGIDHTKIEPKHPTLTLYPDGSEWFEEEHNSLVQSFFK